MTDYYRATLGFLRRQDLARGRSHTAGLGEGSCCGGKCDKCQRGGLGEAADAAAIAAGPTVSASLVLMPGVMDAVHQSDPPAAAQGGGDS